MPRQRAGPKARNGFFFVFFFFFFLGKKILGPKMVVFSRLRIQPVLRLSARISDFENVLLMVHVGGVHACAAGARYATFFFPTPDFDFFGTFEHSPLHIFFS